MAQTLLLRYSYRLKGIDSGAQPLILSPKSMANKTFAEALESTVKWTPELRRRIQKMVRYSNHEGVCNIREHREPPKPEDFMAPMVPPISPPKMYWNYPKIDKIYKPDQQCKAREAM